MRVYGARTIAARAVRFSNSATKKPAMQARRVRRQVFVCMKAAEANRSERRSNLSGRTKLLFEVFVVVVRILRAQRSYKWLRRRTSRRLGAAAAAVGLLMRRR